MNDETVSPEWHDIYTAEQMAVALDHHSAQAAKRGAYHVADELRHAAACIRDLADRLADGEAIALRISAGVNDFQEKARKIMANIESLGKDPS